MSSHLDIIRSIVRDAAAGELQPVRPAVGVARRGAVGGRGFGGGGGGAGRARPVCVRPLLSPTVSTTGVAAVTLARTMAAADATMCDAAEPAQAAAVPRAPALALLRARAATGAAGRVQHSREVGWDARACNAANSVSRGRGAVDAWRCGGCGYVYYDPRVPNGVEARHAVPRGGGAAVPALPGRRMPAAATPADVSLAAVAREKPDASAVGRRRRSGPRIRTFSTILQEEVSGAARPLSRVQAREAQFVQFAVGAAEHTAEGRHILDEWLQEDIREREEVMERLRAAEVAEAAVAAVAEEDGAV
jgi:hypothetical protein